jgi:hypothetical protein
MSLRFGPKSQSEAANKTQKMAKITNQNWGDKIVQGRM